MVFYLCFFAKKGISVITTPMLTRLLFANEYGQFSVFNSWDDILIVFVSIELKYIISKYYLYFEARTHSTIATYGSCVPTLVLGYSVKPVGIVIDLFGIEDGYVIPIQKVNNSEEILNIFKEFVVRRDTVKNNLRIQFLYTWEKQNSVVIFC